MSFTPTHSLLSLPGNLLVTDSNGVILYASASWLEYSQFYGLSPDTEWIGGNILEVFQELIAYPGMTAALSETLQDIVEGERLISSSELVVRTANKGSRAVRLDIFPLLTEQPAQGRNLVLSLHDAGPAAGRGHIQPVRAAAGTRLSTTYHPLIPICASCKSVRSAQEEWITLEHFLQHQLSLQFTHDICPDCIRQLYPKYAAALEH
ncbi:PAS domain-containing protein [Paenibacillus sp. HW567]|uniref:PAS domain-containing protein n=1 Tax=Paenibacillus sp. HW567 TaxID=1034769 RepID=UPI0003787149|nr:PAS domain-containing protein [Paenibacillus sp. HW567]